MLSVSVVLVLNSTNCFSEVTQTDKIVGYGFLAMSFFFISIPLVIISIQTTERADNI